MKIYYKIIGLAMLVFFTSMAFGQRSQLDKLTRKIETKDGFTFTEIKTKDLKIELGENADNEEVAEVLEDIDVIRIIKIDRSEHQNTASKFQDKIDRILEEEIYEQLLYVKDGDDEQLGIYVNRDDSGVISEIALSGHEDDEVMLIYVSGEFDLSTMGLASLKGLEGLGNMGCKEKKVHMEVQ